MRKRLRAKTKRSIACAVFFVALLLIFGIVGGMECGACGLREGVVYLALSNIIAFFAGAKGGLFRL